MFALLFVKWGLTKHISSLLQAIFSCFGRRWHFLLQNAVAQHYVANTNTIKLRICAERNKDAQSRSHQPAAAEVAD
jgi:hypothetical protein